jgi:succinoglycan biosynthesis transport protein ExoP
MTNDTYDIPQPNVSVDLRQYLLLVWHWAWLILLAGAIAGGTAYYLSSRQTPVYMASTRLLISEPPSSYYVQGSGGIVSGMYVSSTYVQMFKDLPVLQQVVDKLQIPMNPLALKGAIGVSLIKDTNLIQVSVTDTNPQRAADIANTLGGVFSERIATMNSARYALSKDNLLKQLADMEAQLQLVNDQLDVAIDTTEKDSLAARQAQYRQIYSVLVSSYEQVRLAEAQSSTIITQVEPALVPYSPISPKPQQSTMLATIVGMLLALGVIFAIDLLDDTVRNPETLSAELNLPILGVIPHHENQDEAPITRTQPRSPVTEAYRILRTNVEYANTDHNLHRILVTSPLPEDGKTTVVTNLAIVMAQRGLRTTLLDGDMRRPRTHKVLGMPNRVGLSNLFLQPELHLNGHVQVTSLKDLSLLASGPLPPNPAELLGSKRMVDILDGLMEEGDMVLIDTPPSLTVTDATVLAPLVDGIILVVKAGNTKMAAVKRQVAALRQVGARLLGVVVNDVHFESSRYSYYYHSYYYRSYYYSDSSSKGGGKGRKKKDPRTAVEGSSGETH